MHSNHQKCHSSNVSHFSKVIVDLSRSDLEKYLMQLKYILHQLLPKGNISTTKLLDLLIVAHGHHCLAREGVVRKDLVGRNNVGEGYEDNLESSPQKHHVCISPTDGAIIVTIL